MVKAAIKAKKHVVTTSYVSPAMQALDEEVKAAGITVMNEIGASRIGLGFMAYSADDSSLILGMPSDHHALSYPSSDPLFPRIDHLYAIDIIDRVHREGGHVRAFRSFCCGLPAPESMIMMTTHEIIEANCYVRLG